MRIAVTGATGRLGRQVTRLLAADGGHEVVAVSRRPATALPAHVDFARADYADPDALRAAFGDVDTLVFISSDGVAVDVLRHHRNVVQAVLDAGVPHVVALSGLDADVASPFCYAATYGETENLLRTAACDVTLARASIFAEFFLGSFLAGARERGELQLPAADAGVSLVSIADVGRGLAALALGRSVGHVHELTGPAALSMATVAEVMSRQWGVPIRYTDVSPADFQRDLAAGDLDPWWCYAFSSMFASIRDHRWERVTEDVARLAGSPPAGLGDLLGD